MISRQVALEISAAHFPKGPEALADHLDIPCIHRPLKGLEGWCASDVNTIIVVNSNSANSRQRFTLAHELAHLIVGTQSPISCKPFQSDKQEEKQADKLAAELLIPWQKLIALDGDQLPVVESTVRHIAAAANVSPIVVACRMVASCQELGMSNAAAIYLENGNEVWRYATNLRFSSQSAIELSQDIAASENNTVRRTLDDGQVLVGSLLDNWSYQLLIAQVLPVEIGQREAQTEQIERIRKELFGGDRSFEGKVSGLLGGLKNKTHLLTLTDAMAEFYKNKLTPLTAEQKEKLQTSEGRDFVRARLSKWFTD